MQSQMASVQCILPHKALLPH